MFNDQYLIDHLDTNQGIKVEAGCFIEINQNDLQNIETVGVFKYGDYNESSLRQWTGDPAKMWVHRNVMTSLQDNKFDLNDYQYFGPRKKSDYFSLVDCFSEFRPRSGINKLVQPVGDGRTFIDDFKSVRRPRFYPAAIEDRFKYWTSWNTDEGPTVGLSNSVGKITNASPFVVYKEPVAANKITVKIQTGIGESVSTINSQVGGTDPLANPALSTIPKRWKIQYLDVFNTWQTAMAINNYDPAVLDPTTGILDIVYTVKNPNPAALPFFVLKGYFDSVEHLPIYAYDGEAFCIGRNHNTIGTLWVWLDGGWRDFGDIDFEWRLADYTMNPEEYSTKDFIDPLVYNPTMNATRAGGDAYDTYTGIVMMRGLRILVDEMVAKDKPFELIELSPRLFANVSDMVISYSVDKAISDEDSVLPVGGMSVSNGTVVLSNMDLALNREMEYNVATRKGSILANRVRKNTKFLFYEIVREVSVNGVLYDKFVPVKNLYVVDKPVVVSGSEDVSITLRDFNFRFEEERCPNLVLKDCSLTKAVATVLDSIGFSNYIFYFGERSTYNKDLSPLETVFPYFFVNETQSVAEVLEQLSIASQCAMFFDEYNNFVVMPREHFKSDPQYVLRGGSSRIVGKYPNIESIEVNGYTIADADITFIHRDIARGTLPIKFVDENTSATRAAGEAGNVTAYKPSSVWDVQKMESATLSAGPLNSYLSANVPTYSPSSPDGVANNTFDLGIYAQYFPFSGLISMNGEVIEYDAKEYMIGGRQVWVESQNHLNELVGRSSFTQADGSGQMIFPTGKMRIMSELSVASNGALTVVKHGRGRFGTTVQSHTAEPADWINGPTYKFEDTALDTLYGKLSPTAFTYDRYTDGAHQAVIPQYNAANNYIYNSLHSRNSVMSQAPMTISAADVTKLSAERRIMRSSALSFTGESNASANSVYMKTKVLPGGHYNLFGARIGIVGKQFAEEQGSISQDANGATTLGTYQMAGDDTLYSVEGGGGGLLIFSNRNWTTGGKATSNDGYYFEIIALSSSYSVRDDEGIQEVVFANVNFYKINRGKLGGTGASKNVPVKLFSTYADILVTSGSQTVRDRTIPSELTTVYDLAVEAKKVGTFGNYQRVFHLYINDVLVGVVNEPGGGDTGYFPDWERGPEDNTEIGVFVRGSSEIQVEHLYAVGTESPEPSPVYTNQKIMSRPRAFKVFSPSAIYNAGKLDGGRSKDSIFFEEFGTIAREVKNVVAKFDVYPVLLSAIAKRPIFDRTFSISGYYADPFEANFMLWSQADRLINLGEAETTLSIIGLPFADNPEQTLTVDDFLTGEYEGAPTNISYDSGNEFRKQLIAARAAGKTEKINFESLFIQNREFALKMMRWLTGFMGKEMVTLDIEAFGVPHLQIGDIVTVDYDIPYLTEEVVPMADVNTPLDPLFVQKTIPFIDNGKRFMIQSISVDRDIDGPNYQLRLVEMPDVATWMAGDF
jgi:hypothetical protein